MRELNINEIKDVNGGQLPAILIALAYVEYTIYQWITE